MRSILSAAAVVAAAIALAGCAAPQPLLKPTASGLAEARFHARTIDDVRNAIVGGCMRIGGHAASSQHEVICTLPITGGQEAMARLAIGNSYSTPVVARTGFNLVQSGPNVDVVARNWIETQMVTGQVRRMPVEATRSTNDVQSFLLGLGGI